METKEVRIKQHLKGNVTSYLLEAKVKKQVDKLNITETTRSRLLSKLYRKSKKELLKLQEVKGNKLIYLI